MFNRLILKIIVALIVFCCVACNEPENVRTTGTIEAIEVNISTMVAGRIAFECCIEGEMVKEGDVVIQLENEEFKALVEQAAAGVEKSKGNILVAEAAVESAKASILSTDADITKARAFVNKSKVKMEQYEREKNRFTKLYAKDTVSTEKYESAHINYISAEAGYKSAEAELLAAKLRKEAATSQLKMQESQLITARASLRLSKANLAYQQARLAQTTVHSSISGMVVFKAFEEGEIVNPGITVMTIVDMKNLYVRADVDENKISRVPLKSKVDILIESRPEKVFQGTVVNISRYAEFATQRDVTRGRQDIKTFKVKIAIENQDRIFKPGMTVEVAIDPKASNA